MEAGKAITAGGGGHPGARTILQGGDTGIPDVQVGVLGDVRRDDTGGGGYPCWFSKSV